MLNVSQVTSMLQSLGVSSSVAAKAAERVSNNGNSGNALNFLEDLQQALENLSTKASNTLPQETAQTTKTDLPAPSKDLQKHDESSAESNTVTAPFNNFEEFREWEKGLGSTFAKDYKTPDYIRLIRLSLEGGDNDAFKRYVFFKNNPQYAVDYEAIRNGNLSKFPTDGTTLIKSDLSKMDTETATFYKNNHHQLLASEGFSMDPTLLKMRMDGKIDNGDTDWLTKHRWTENGIVANDNRLTYAQSEFIGLDGKGINNYRLAKYDNTTGMLVDLDGNTYDPVTGQATT